MPDSFENLEQLPDQPLLTEPRLYWAGHRDLGGVLVVAVVEELAILAAHKETCDCDEEADCVASGGWSVTDIEEEISPARLRLVPRKQGDPPTPVKADGPRLWWLYSDENGKFVVARTKDEAQEHYANGDGVWDCVEQIRRVDGYDVIVEEAASGA